MNWLKRKRVSNAGSPKGFWGAVTLTNMNDDHADLTDEGLKKLTLTENAVCLDVGCGGGRTLARLSEIATNGKIFGVDISETAVKCAKAYNIKDVKAGKIKVKMGSASALPFPKETFDAVTAVETFYFWNDKPQAVKNVYEVLKSGGEFIIMLDAYEDGTGSMDEIKEEIDGRFNLELNTPEEIEKMFTEAGFADVKVDICGKRLYAKGRK